MNSVWHLLNSGCWPIRFKHTLK